MEIRTFGGGGRQCECERILSATLRDKVGRLILLPIPTAKDKKYITGTATSVGEIAAMLSPGDTVVGYDIPREIREKADTVGTFSYDAGADEDFLIENAELTARGAIGYILTHTKRDLADMRVGVVGYGRIGSCLVRWLLTFGCRPTVYTGRETVVLELGEMGISACTIGEVGNLSGLDLLINTAPARQIEEGRIPPDLEIIDLASGSIFEPSQRLKKLSSIPDAFYPLTAGKLYAEAILGALSGGEK